MNMCTVLTKLTKTISVIDVQKLKLCRDSDQNLYKVQDCTTFFSYTPSQGSIFVLWSKKLKRVPHMALLLTLVARPSLADC